MTGQLPTSWRDISFRVRDGLRLHARHYPARHASAPAVVCLAGLTRNGRDFHDLAHYLSTRAKGSRHVYTLDFRGRGNSDHDPDWKNYTVPREAQDTIDFLALIGRERPSVVGTSRGGLVAMVCQAIQPASFGAIVLNDIGPVIEREGLIRIAGYVGSMPNPTSWADAARQCAASARGTFPGVDASTWDEVARQIFNEVDGRPVPGYDPKLAKAVGIMDGPPPPLWPQFDALLSLPLLMLRGEHSDILSRETMASMLARHPRAVGHEIAGQGHAPLLKDIPTAEIIAQFLDVNEIPARAGAS